MARENFNDLFAYVLVAREGSFTRAAALLGVSQPALSQTIRALEERLGYRLLTRTTRSVSPTEAGERVLATLAPRFDEMERELAELRELRDKPAGSVRITCSDHAADTIVLPKVAGLLAAYPDIQVEVFIDYAFTDIVAQKFDVGIRLGDEVAKDMIAVRVGPDLRMAVVGAPAYFELHPPPVTPQQLTEHNCINFRLPTHGGLYAWEFAQAGRAMSVRVEGQLTFNMLDQMLDAAVKGYGLAYVAEDLARPHVASGELVHVLRDW
jgi:DNA-binding transcriptional LysR family regulator